MGDLRIGMIGTGMMGCEHIKNVMGIPEARITAISDPNEEPRGWARLTMDGRYGDVAEFTDHRALLDSGLVDAVLVSSPNFTHKAVLDDVFAELDPGRRERFGSLIRNRGQVFIATPRREDVPFAVDQLFNMERGRTS
mgnify:CR=1 FL=1